MTPDRPRRDTPRRKKHTKPHGHDSAASSEGFYSFPPQSDWVKLDERADDLPDIVHVPIEDAVANEELQGWEDEWFSQATFDAETWGALAEPKIDFVYTWVNGSDKDFVATMRPYEKKSILNDPEGEWIASHGSNRYRSWDELRYSIRSVERFAGAFLNQIQILVNAVDSRKTLGQFTKQRPTWLRDDEATNNAVRVLSQEEFFDADVLGALPSFNSLTIESQLYNTPSDVDRFFALSDDMILGRHHAAADIFSPLYGPTLGFKVNGYNTQSQPTEADARRFGEKPFLIYTSWLLNRRFGLRKRKGQVHFGHSMSRSLALEVRNTFPRPSLHSACQRFRGETGFQLYTWYAAFHYTIERHREALLYSYLVLRSDANDDGNLDWDERSTIMAEIEEGIGREGKSFRTRQYYNVTENHRLVGLEPPQVNREVLWTSLDGPAAIKDLECDEFNVNECLAPGFSSDVSDAGHRSLVFDKAVIFDRVARQDPACGDCLLKLILNRQKAGMEPLLPHKSTPEKRAIVLKALKRYQYSIVEPDALFVMVTDSEQVEHTLFDRLSQRSSEGKLQVGQLCLNDDVTTKDIVQLEELQNLMFKLFNELVPQPSKFEI
ncbi:hypothetical protein B0T11DRAFT_217663 [Plectosphaerella cucumerina]|uniref:Stealth protein CR2 conserved region 2 domain-containing protein n=1 Tax=Plectosphaerella cucumerina TaxID=40658 RepID=A0A8K0TTP0_9PEZI|nr:hypothetical protein B0T11DRAFT_217663 [Plectosphaerella cucumerina]